MTAEAPDVPPHWTPSLSTGNHGPVDALAEPKLVVDLSTGARGAGSTAQFGNARPREVEPYSRCAIGLAGVVVLSGLSGRRQHLRPLRRLHAGQLPVDIFLPRPVIYLRHEAPGIEAHRIARTPEALLKVRRIESMP